VKRENRTPSKVSSSQSIDLRIYSIRERRGREKRRHILTICFLSPKFENCVSFDNTAGTTKADFSININSRHRDYHYSELSRTYLTILHAHEISHHALDWIFSQFLEDGDTLVCLRIVGRSVSTQFDNATWRKHQQREVRQLMKELKERNREDVAICISLEYSAARIDAVIQDTVSENECDGEGISFQGESCHGGDD
jgi:hypothetical protein